MKALTIKFIPESIRALKEARHFTLKELRGGLGIRLLDRIQQQNIRDRLQKERKERKEQQESIRKNR